MQSFYQFCLPTTTLLPLFANLRQIVKTGTDQEKAMGQEKPQIEGKV